MRLIRAVDLARACSMSDAIDAVAHGFRALSQGQADVPVRIHAALAEGGLVGAMPASLEGSPHFAVKVVSIAPAAIGLGLPLIGATVLLGDRTTGALLALIDGTSLTALRTGAGGGVAARALAREDARTLALFGAGVQARAQLEAALAVRSVREVRIVSRDPAHAEACAAWGRERFPAVTLRVTGADEALDGADLVIAATTSDTPVFDGARLGPGVHVTGVGSHRPHMRELDSATLRGALLTVDQRAGALHEAGELQGLGPGDVVELGEVLAGTVPGRTSPGQRTVFKSVGNGIQDLVVASLAYTRSLERGLGDEVAWP